jgi:uncharacterized protein YciI
MDPIADPGDERAAAAVSDKIDESAEKFNRRMIFGKNLLKEQIIPSSSTDSAVSSMVSVDVFCRLKSPMAFSIVLCSSSPPPMEKIQPHMDAHMAYIKQQFADGRFLFSGRKVPRTGGIIVSNIETREQLDDIINQDPFERHQLADFDVIEFSVTTTCKGLEVLKEL